MDAPRETPEGFLLHANEFFLAAELVLNRANGVVSLPAYFLFGRSIELSLKAFLLRCGMKITKLRSPKFGHDLSALLDEAMKRGLICEVPLNQREVAVVHLLNEDYEKKKYEYLITRGTYSLPLIEVTEEVSRKLANELKEFCSSLKTIYIDSCAWNYLFNRRTNLLVELPPERYRITITREIEIEIIAIPDEGKDKGGNSVDKRPLKCYIHESIEANRVHTSSAFGFLTQDPDGSSSKCQTYAGFNHGTFQSQKDRDFYASDVMKGHVCGKEARKSGLSHNQADASLAARSSDSIILTDEKKNKTGPLHTAFEDGGRVVFLTDDVDPSGLSLGDYLNKFAVER